MAITMSEKIKIVIKRRNMTIANLADSLGQSRQNITNKLTRNNFTERELKKIATALNCEFIGNFKLNDTGEEI